MTDQQDDQDDRPPTYTAHSTEARFNRPLHERYPQIRPNSGWADSRVRASGPGRGAGGEREPERSALLTARLAIAITVVVGQLWALTVATDAWMRGDTRTAWWTTALSGGSFLVVLLVWALGPRRDR
ncbi:hypothetical protein [Kitasatospora viridis]|uniref:Uncharacterized protein n=1 Tax=Kitasatospora viridis TaxID=281105 RepID=A0A561UKG4_9ACTN|nr:hypothetical protein [Kitasatospora viridis]TWF99858.1 hypothetical protein FHX73_113716 [Kitasatospora viridis]